jgi:MoaA/NifB/PqqE/SkfB family radical SAM enzyme
MRKEIEIELAITSFCQAKCPSCARTESIKRRPGELNVQHVPFDKISKVVKNIHSDATITLCGEFGDPMMHPDVLEIIEMFHNNGNVVMVHTNGGLRTPDVYKKLAQMKRVRMSFGIDGMDAETSGMYRKEVDWDRAWENMNTYFDECRKQGRVGMQAGEWLFLIFDFNKHQIDEVFEYCQEKQIHCQLRINDRWYGYVGDEEYKVIKEKIDDLRTIRNA